MNEKKKIIEKAMDLFLRYGVKSVSMDDLSRQLGMSKKTIYEHVINKEDLVRQVVNNHLRCQKDTIRKIHDEASDAIDEMVNIARYIIEMFENMSDATLYDLKKYYRKVWDEWEEFHRAHVYEVTSANIRNGIEQGLYREDMQPDIIARLYVVKSTAIVDEDIFPSNEFRKHDLFREYLHYHMRGILSTRGFELYKTYLEKSLNRQTI